MKTLLTIVITTAVCCAMTLTTDFARGIQKGIDARDEFVQLCDENSFQNSKTRVRTTGALATTLTFENVPGDEARIYSLISETLHSTEAGDRNFRMVLRSLGFRYIQVGRRRIVLRNTETVHPGNGSVEHDFPDVG
jgi:hypothetical protein